MPFIGKDSRRSRTSRLSFTKKKTYSVQDAPPTQKEERRLFNFRSGGAGTGSRRNTAPSGILKRGGNRPMSYLALEDGMVPQEMAAAVPMPREPELNELFAEMVVSLLCRLPCINM